VYARGEQPTVCGPIQAAMAFCTVHRAATHTYVVHISSLCQSNFID